MRYDADALMNLLPAFYRVQDTDGSLRALMGVIAEQIGVVEDDLDALYADGFIETCAEWAIPYLGDLIGYRPLPGTTSRSEVANTIGYRRRKGTAGVLEDLARDVAQTSAAAVVEYFAVLATTAHLAHPRPERAGMASLRDIRALGRIDTAFDRLPRTMEARRIGPRRGRFNVSNIGISLYRNRTLRVADADPFRIADLVYAFHPLGLDQALCRPAETEGGLDSRTTERNVPVVVRRRTLEKEFDEHRQRLTDNLPSTVDLPFRIVLNGVELAPEELVVAEIGKAAVPFPAASVRTHTRTNAPTISTDYGIVAAIDPVRGRMVFRENVVVASLRVGYAYSFPAPIGGGSYDWESVAGAATHQVGAGAPFATLADALADLAGAAGVVEIVDSGTYDDDVMLTVAAGSIAGTRNRIVVRAQAGERPTLAPPNPINIDGDDGEVILEGLLIGDAGIACGGDVGTVELRHCTVTGPMLGDHDLAFVRSVVQSAECEALAVTDTVILGDVDADRLRFEGVTALSDVDAGEIDEVSNSIVMGKLVAGRLGAGCVRFSFLGAGSAVPKPHRCVLPPVLPIFASQSLTHLGFARLHSFCPEAILGGADDRGEMGAYGFLQEPRKEANLRIRLDEYLRIGLEAGIERADEREIQR